MGDSWQLMPMLLLVIGTKQLLTALQRQKNDILACLKLLWETLTVILKNPCHDSEADLKTIIEGLRVKDGVLQFMQSSKASQKRHGGTLQ